MSSMKKGKMKTIKLNFYDTNKQRWCKNYAKLKAKHSVVALKIVFFGDGRFGWGMLRRGWRGTLGEFTNFTFHIKFTKIPFIIHRKIFFHVNLDFLEIHQKTLKSCHNFQKFIQTFPSSLPHNSQNKQKHFQQTDKNFFHNFTWRVTHAFYCTVFIVSLMLAAYAIVLLFVTFSY